MHVVMHGLKHQTIAAERDDCVGFCRRSVAIAFDERGAGIHRIARFAGYESDPFKICHDWSVVLSAAH